MSETNDIQATEAEVQLSNPTEETNPVAATNSEGDQKDTLETTTETPEYKPDYKIKAYDEEKEIDDPFLKALIKDAESEKKVKELAQKSLGFETVKFRYEREKNEYKTYQDQTKPIVDYYNQASQFLQKKDLESFVEFVGIDKQEIYKLAVKMAEEEQLPQDQRSYMQQQKQIQRERDYLANQNQIQMSQQQQQLSQFRNQELNWQLQRPDVLQVSQTYDARKAPDAPAFRELVAEIGMAHHARTQGREDLSAEQAVQKAMKMIGAFVSPTNVNGGPAPQQNHLMRQNEAPPIIPNVTGRGTSPVKKRVSNLDDLKKLAEERTSS